jgi:hypothetical protein
MSALGAAHPIVYDGFPRLRCNQLLTVGDPQRVAVALKNKKGSFKNESIKLAVNITKLCLNENNYMACLVVVGGCDFGAFFISPKV